MYENYISLSLSLLLLLSLLSIINSMCLKNVKDYDVHYHTRKAFCLQDAKCPSTIECEIVLELLGSGDAMWKLCADNLYDFDENGDNPTCLVYSFGISNDYAFDLTMGRLGCEVHMFDPTVSYPYEFSKNVYFHNWGLYGGNIQTSYSMKFKSKYYGTITGEMYTINEIIQKLGHNNRTISVFKIDCEGCELELFGFHQNHNHQNYFIHQMKQMLVEFHFSTSLGIDKENRIPLLGNSYDTIFDKNLFSKFYQYDRDGYIDDQIIIPELLELGFPRNMCCREIGFIKKECRNFKITKEYIFTRYRESLENKIFGLHSARGTDKRIYVMINGTKRLFPTADVFVSHGYDFFDTPMEKDVYGNWIEDGPDMVIKMK